MLLTLNGRTAQIGDERDYGQSTLDTPAMNVLQYQRRKSWPTASLSSSKYSIEPNLNNAWRLTGQKFKKGQSEEYIQCPECRRVSIYFY